jgi:hypothetical protein
MRANIGADLQAALHADDHLGSTGSFVDAAVHRHARRKETHDR